jgi:N-acetylmuramoyl-L-alanine amidase
VAVSSDGQPVPPSSTKRGDYSLSRQLGLRVAKIVIDPGHGGHDPGAMANGITESELVLDVALRLEKLLLQTPGVEVVLTRRTNEFVPLEERTAIANRERADLFLSIHANSHNQSAVRGIESYFLNFATTPDAEAVAARENAASVGRMGTLPAIVKAITMNDKLEESRELASCFRRGWCGASAISPAAAATWASNSAVRRAHRRPDAERADGNWVPDEQVRGRAHQTAAPQRQLIAQSLRDAIVRYQDSLKKVTAPAPQTRRE